MLCLAILLGCTRAILDISTRNAEHISESTFLRISTKNDLEENSHFSNLKTEDGNIKLRGENGSGTFIALNRENMIDNWSAIIKLKKPVLKETQQASVQLWYTDAPVKEGNFMGVDGKFVGFLAGLEFTAKHSSAIFTFNYGFDFTGKEKIVLQKDRLDQHIFEGLDEITLKIVHTGNNFLIELYDGKKLLSDSFRIHQSLLPVEKGIPRHFGLTTSYKSCPESISLELTDFKIMERGEGESYDAYDSHIDINTHTPTKSTKEVLHAIATLNHFISYAEIAVGKDGSSFTDVQSHLKELVRNQRYKLDEMIAHVRERTKTDEDGVHNDTKARIDAFDTRLTEIHRQLMEYRNVLRRIVDERPYNLRDGANIIFVFTIIATLILVIGRVARRYSISSVSTEKKK